MARARILKPGFFWNDRLAEIPPYGRLLFAGLWTLADREGRLPDRPKWIKGTLFPYENPPVERLLEQLAAAGFITRYEATGDRYIEVSNFLKHQSPHVKEGASTIPAPCSHGASTMRAPDETSASTGNSGTDPSVYARDPVSDPVYGNGIRYTETVTGDDSPGAPPEHPFAFAFAQRYRERHAGRTPSAIEHGLVLSLETEFGAEACIAVATELDWQKPANYMRPILEERRNGPTQTRRSNARNGMRSYPTDDERARDQERARELRASAK